MVQAQGSRRRLTYEDYLRLPETNRRCELRGGSLVWEPSPAYDHQWIVGNLHLLLRAAAAQAGGRVILGPFDTVLSREEAWVGQPDLLCVSQARLDIIGQRCLAGSPDLVVEVVSPSSRGKERRLRSSLHARYGIREYWIVEPRLRTVDVLVQAPDRYLRLGTFGPGDPLRSQVLSRLDADAGAVFAGLPAPGEGPAAGRG